MCGRFSLYEPSERVARAFGVDDVAPGEPDARFNIAPSQRVFAVVCSRDGTTRRLGTLKWGLVPSWAKDPSVGNRMINVRAETVASAASFRRAFEGRRCLVPVNGFFEWLRPNSGRGAGRPFYAHSPDKALLALGGIWEVWHGPDDQVLRTLAIITTIANARLADVHDRMPVIVEHDDWARWLEPSPLEPAEAGRLLRSSPDDRVEIVQVSDLVNSPKIDVPELLEPAA
jgi:putative SOS response-associated peptidase YedK